MNKKELDKYSKKLINGLKVIGQCKCGGAIFVSTTCEKEHLFNYYCSVCGSVGDVRFPKSGEFFNHTPDERNPIQLLIKHNEDAGREISDETIEKTPVSPYVNEGQGSL